MIGKKYLFLKNRNVLAGELSCTAENAKGKVTGRNVKIPVLQYPVVILSHSNVTHKLLKISMQLKGM